MSAEHLIGGRRSGKRFLRRLQKRLRRAAKRLLRGQAAQMATPSVGPTSGAAFSGPTGRLAAGAPQMDTIHPSYLRPSSTLSVGAQAAPPPLRTGLAGVSSASMQVPPTSGWQQVEFRGQPLGYQVYPTRHWVNWEDLLAELEAPPEEPVAEWQRMPEGL